jgi:uncharacterized protein (DUF433 family)
MIANGMTPDDVVTELPPLDLEDVAAALRFAHRSGAMALGLHRLELDVGHAQQKRL